MFVDFNESMSGSNSELTPSGLPAKLVSSLLLKARIILSYYLAFDSVSLVVIGFSAVFGSDEINGATFPSTDTIRVEPLLILFGVVFDIV
jgi:hypothetical protein